MKYAIVFHEILGVAEVETNQGEYSQYPISKNILQFVRRSNKYELGAEAVFANQQDCIDLNGTYESKVDFEGRPTSMVLVFTQTGCESLTIEDRSSPYLLRKATYQLDGEHHPAFYCSPSQGTELEVNYAKSNPRVEVVFAKAEKRYIQIGCVSSMKPEWEKWAIENKQLLTAEHNAQLYSLTKDGDLATTGGLIWKTGSKIYKRIK